VPTLVNAMLKQEIKLLSGAEQAGEGLEEQKI